MLIIVAIMYIQQTNSRGKYRCYLLLENYREGGKVKHRTIANLSRCSEEEIAAMKLALKHKHDLSQLVLVSEAGRPLSIEVFPGNTHDAATVASQIRKVAERFGCGDVTFVGDRGMIKNQQAEDMAHYGFHYITAITKPQIESLLTGGVLHMDLFDQRLAEVETDDGVRYILRRNPERAVEMRRSRDDKVASLRRMTQKQNEYLAAHPRAGVEVALRKINERCETLNVSRWVKAAARERKISLVTDQEALSEIEKLDGCYVLKTDLNKQAADKETVHARYKDLAQVEWAFRTSKTVHLEMRPVNVRLADRTRAHAFVVMLAYRIVQELAARWREIDLTVEEGIKELTTLCADEVLVQGTPRCNKIPEPRPQVQQLLKAAGVRLPEALPCRGVRVATRKKLTKNRSTH